MVGHVIRRHCARRPKRQARVVGRGQPSVLWRSAVAKKHPDYYWKLELRPRLYLTLFIIAIFALSLWILASFALPFILSQVWGIV